MRIALQDPHLIKLRDEQTPITIALSNGVKISGRVESFDQYVENTPTTAPSNP